MNTCEQKGGRSAFDEARENEGEERDGGDVA
jgi:hypothetical protein